VNFFVIDNPPANVSDYVKVPSTDSPNEFIVSLVQLLEHGTPHICTEAISIDWATSAFQIAKAAKRYNALVVRAPEDFGESGTPHGYFFFRQISPENRDSK
jgi:hypothetical protein